MIMPVGREVSREMEGSMMSGEIVWNTKRDVKNKTRSVQRASL